MPVIEFLGRCKLLTTNFLRGFIVVVLVVQAPSLAETASPARPNTSSWVLKSEREEPIQAKTFAPKDKKLEGQALLLWTELADSDQAGPVKVETVLGGLFSELDEYRLTGRKSVVWGQRPSEVVSFMAEVSKRPFIGRMLLTTGGDGPVTALVLLTLSEFHESYLENFDHLERRWDHSQTAVTNVLYSE